MSYSTIEILTDAMGRPIPQYYDASEDAFKPMSNAIISKISQAEGENAVVPVNSAGIEKFTTTNPAFISANDGNISSLGLKADTAVTNPLLSGSAIALLKGLLKQLQGSGGAVSAFIPVTAAGAEKFTGSNPGCMEVYDGDFASIGSTADAAVTDYDSTGAVIALLKGILKQLQGDSGIISEVTVAENVSTISVESNTSLVAKTTLTWNGTDTTDDVESAITSTDSVLIWVSNACDKELTVTLEHEVEEGIWVPYVGGDGTAVSFTVAASTGAGVYGPFQKWPKYLGGRVVLTAESAPTASGTTTVQIQGV